MAELLRFPDTYDLPILGEETVVLGTEEEYRAAALRGDSFVRRAGVRGCPGAETLGKILEIAGEAFAEVAEGAGADVIHRRYALHPTGLNFAFDDYTPVGYKLVVEVESITPPKGHDKLVDPSPRQRAALERSRDRYKAQHRGRPQLRDPGPQQYANGVSKRQSGLIMIDPDAWLTLDPDRNT